MNLLFVFGMLLLLPHCGWSSQATACPPKPISRADLLSLLLADPRRGAVDRALEKQGVAFQPTEDYLEVLRAAGARDELIEKVRKAGAAAATNPLPGPSDDSLAGKEKQILPHLLQAVRLKKGGDAKGSAEEFRAAVAAEPDNPLLHLDLASALAGGAGKREREAAIAEDRRAVRLAPALALVHVRLADDLLPTIDRDRAVAEYRKAAELDPDDVDVYRRLGRLLEIMGDSRGAAEALKEAATREPDEASLRIEYAYLLGSTGDAAGALVQAREAVRIAPTTAIVHHALARVMLTRGDEAGAAKEEQAATAIQASNPPKRIRVGGQVMSAKLVYQPLPVYPADAQLTHVEGQVHFSTLIAADGTVANLKLVSGPPRLAQAAADAVSKWRYQPILLNGQMAEIETEIVVNFGFHR